MNTKPPAARAGILLLLILLALGGFIGWTAMAEVDQIAHTQGQVISTARTQVIQAANDGVIEAVLVKEGEAVRRGQVLARLDQSQAEAAQRDSLGKVAALKATLVRLQAEVFERGLNFPAELLQAYPAFVQNQRELYTRRRRAIQAEVSALEESLRLIREELAIAERLLASGDVGRAEVIRLQKQVAETRGQITNRRNKYFQDAQAEMTKAEEDLSTQEQVLIERTALLQRTVITAPVDGLVNSIQLTTVGAKVRPGEVIMELLPTGSALIVEARLKPSDIAFVRTGHAAAVKLDAFDYSIYGVLPGKVSYISPDAFTEKVAQGNQVYYRVHVRLDEDALAQRNRERPARSIAIQPGMTAAVDIITGQQSILAYLTKPVTKTLSESMRER